MTPETRIRPAERGDIAGVVDVHLASFPGFFLSILGPRFLRLFYTGLIEIEGGLMAVAEQRSSIVGFVGGSTEQVNFYLRMFRRCALPLAVAGVPAMFRHPSIVGRVARGRRRAQGHADTREGACLMTIGVSPSIESAGIGRALVNEFEAMLRQRDVFCYSLTTDAENNERVNRFYESLGLTKTREFVTVEGRQLNEYIKFIKGDEDPPDAPADPKERP